jgi:hypothetical protein
MPFRIFYFVGFLLVFALEVAIGIGAVGGSFVRGSVGDMLVIILIYCLLRAAFNLVPIQATAIAVAAGFVAEALQSVHLADLIGLKPGSMLYIIVGNTASLSDLVMYLLGGLMALALDHYLLVPWIVARDRERTGV